MQLDIKEMILMTDEILLLKAYVERSKYRLKTLKAIGNETKIPKTIANESGIRLAHISKVLKELKDHNLAVCINEEAHKGRLYRLTDKGLIILGEL